MRTHPRPITLPAFAGGSVRPLLLAMLAGLAASCWADTSQLHEVLVVGSTPLAGAGVPLSEVPSNAQTLDGRELRNQGVNNLADLLDQNLGSVSVSNGVGNPYQNDVSYRGFQATSLLGASVGLSVYVDGVRMNEPFGSVVNWDLIPANAISGLSVLPGSNPLFGMNTLGGALTVQTKNGKDAAGQQWRLQTGSFGHKAVAGEVGWRDDVRGTDHFIALNLDRQDGYREHSKSDVRQFFGKTRWNGGGTKAELSLTLADNHLSGTQALPLSMMDNPKRAYTWPDALNNQMTLLNLKVHRDLSDTSYTSGNLYHRHTRSRSLNSNAEYDEGCAVVADVNQCHASVAGGTAINSMAANGLNLAQYTADVNTSLVHSRTQQKTWGGTWQWTDMGKLAGRDNSLTLGASAEHSKIAYAQDTTLGRLVGYEVVESGNPRYYFPATASASGSGLIRGVRVDGQSRNLSLFFSDALQWTPQWTATASGSYNIAVVNQTGRVQQHLQGDGGYTWTGSDGVAYYNPNYFGAQFYDGSTLHTIDTAAVGTRTAGPESSSLDGNHRFKRFNPAFGLNYNPSQQWGLFGGYNESMRAPTSIELSCADPARPCALPTGFNGDPDLKPVVARTWELGGRGALAGGWSWNAAVYHTRLQDDIQFIHATSTTGYFANVGQTRRRGLEAGLARKQGAWLYAAQLGLVRATYESEWTNPQGQQVQPGNRIPGMSDRSLKLRAAWDMNANWRWGANVVLASGQYAHGDEGNQNAKVPGYGVINIDLRYRIDKAFTLTARLNNVGAKSYSTYGVMGTNIYNGREEQFRTPAPLRTAWVGVNWSLDGK